MEEKKYSILNPRMGVWALLVLLIVQPAIGAVLWRGKFKVESANPWKLEIVESYGPGKNVTPPRLFRSEKTGLPYVTEDRWMCVGRLPSESDVGQIYEFIGTIPDIGGSYSFESMGKSLAFRSKWSQLPFRVYKVIGTTLFLVTVVVLVIFWWIRKLYKKTT